MMYAPAVRARVGPRGDQTVEIIVDHGYRPQSIVARAGVSIRVVFRRRDTDDCTDRVVFSSPHIDRRLARGGATTIVLPAQPPGEIRFTCGMGRYHGLIQLRPEHPSLLVSARGAARRGVDRALQVFRGSVERTVADVAMATLRGRFARGELSQREFQLERALALAAEGESRA